MKEELNSYDNNKYKMKIEINSEIDLCRVPVKKLKNSKLSDFNGSLIYQLLIEMINNSEKGNNIFSPKPRPRNIIITNSASRSKERLRKTNEDTYNRGNKFENNYYLNNGILQKFNNINDSNQFRIGKIIFQIKYDTKFGEDISVIGSINELGNWDINRALKLGWNDGNIWKGTLVLSNNIKDFEYKFILKYGNYVKRWEDGYNRKINLLKIKDLIETYPGNYSHVYLKNIEGINIDYYYDDSILNLICQWNIK